jgi:hypothetical protein
MINEILSLLFQARQFKRAQTALADGTVLA